MFEITIGEYTFRNNNGIVTVKRYGEDCKDYITDNVVLALLHKIEEYSINNDYYKGYNDGFEDARNIF